MLAKGFLKYLLSGLVCAVSALAGATVVKPGDNLQAVLNKGEDLELQKGAVYEISAILRYKTPGQKVYTRDAQLPSEYATLRLVNKDQVTILDAYAVDEAVLERVLCDGNRYLYFHNPHYRETIPSSAIVSGTHKLMHFYERPDIPMLFDLAADEGEVTNIAKQNPELHKQLFDQMMSYFKQVGARMPKVNPDYDPETYKAIKNYDQRMLWGPFEGKRPLEKDEK